MQPNNDTITAFLAGIVVGAAVSFFAIESDEDLNLNQNQRIVAHFQEVEGLPNNYSYKSWRLQQEIKESRVRVLCWVMTHPKNHETKAKYIRYSWGKQCNKIIFISDGESKGNLPVVKVDAPPGRKDLWKKVRNAFLHIYDKYKGEYDWVLKADDDTFVNVHSLRSFLFGHNPNDALFFGEQLRSSYGQLFMAGGGGYVLSREGVHKLVNLLRDNRTDDEIGCNRVNPTSEEDPSLSYCLNLIKVKATDSRDRLGMNRFSQHNGIERGKSEGATSDWYWRYQHYTSTITEGFVGCCSGSAISFHYMSPISMFQYNFLMQSVNPDDSSLTLKTHRLENWEDHPNLNV